MKRKSFETMQCSVAQSLEVIGEWWTPLILRDLMMGVSRYEEMQERLGIARNILVARLAHLEEAGVVEKVPYQAHPKRNDYRLTAKGRDLWLVIEAMREWGDRWAAPGGPPIEIVHRSCGELTHVVPTCAHCGEVLEYGELRMIEGPGAGDHGLLPTRSHPAS